ncbi:MAG: bifunctional heptose 7-phosphate kinase/heptose 1-phosphate adenyltransferase [Thermoleophilaceae bacterium]|nr:bifunctional heptose 7-phosphate kinase/heptose 1-phosphate adenyltransferase [Thermoleophilaceae bacterium]
MSRGPVVVIGDALLDRDVHGIAERLSPDAPVPVLDELASTPRPGGAGLAAALAARDARPVTLVTALAGDAAGVELRAELERLRVEVVDIGLKGPTPEKVRFLAGERPLMRLDRSGRGGSVGTATAAARAAIGWADAVLVSDYGRGVAAEPGLRGAIAELRARVPVVWDPHPRGATPVPRATVATPNEGEAARFAPMPSADGTPGAADRAEAMRRAWRVEAVCLTRGRGGALLVTEQAAPLALPATPAPGGDPCGAGDRFASHLACALADGATLADAAREATAVASAFVAAGGARRALDAAGGASCAAETDAVAVAERVRAAGGTVVATGGCFDLLHAGHVRTLQAARRLGDCLVVCLNSDASVRRLKGPGRPLVSERDRASVLAALGCVDATMVFDEETPERALGRLRPHVWAKGGDYQGMALPEEAALAEWGGRVVLLPYVSGHSTTRLIEEAQARG